MCKTVEGIGAKIVPVGVGETEVTFLPPSNINLDVNKEGFKLKAEGYSEDFLLQLVATLKGQSIEARIVQKPSYLAPTALKATESNETTSNEENAPNEPTVTLKSNPVPTLADKFGGKAKDLYATAGVEHKEQEHDYFHTGIKYDEHNRPKYRCAYECPKCGESGRHYIPFHISRVSCHKCNTPLLVEPATENGKGDTEEHRDANGNFLYAEVIDYTVQQWDKSGR